MRVSVVGGGVMGAATAWQLQRRGVDVTLHEQFAEATHRNGSSHGGSRIFRFAYEDPMYVRLAQAALGEWRALEEAAGEPLLDITGGVDHGTTAEIERLSAALTSAGAPHQVMPGSEAEARFPGMRFDERVVVHPDGGRCRAEATVAALHRLVDDVRYGERVEDPHALDADVVVLAVGAWTRLPGMTVTREQIHHFRPLDPSFEWPSFIHRRASGIGIYGLDTPGEGVKVAEHLVGDVVDPDRRSFDLDPVRRAAAVRYVEEWLPGLDPTPGNEATCLYTTTVDQDFVLRRDGDVVHVSPCSGHGFKFAPEIGRLAAGLALGEPLPPDLAARF